MKKRVLAALLASLVIALPGCSAVSEGAGSDSKEAQNIEIGTSDGITGEEADEQEAGQMQAEADAIDEAHEEDGYAQTSVEKAGWDGRSVELEAAASWIRQSSSATEDGGFAETYVYEDRLEYGWSCVPSGETDAETAAGEYIADNGWTASSVAVNGELTEKLGVETYEYTAYEDDRGYSVLHRGIVAADAGAYYTADFCMMEGDMGIYEPSVQEWIGEISLT